MNKPTKKSPSRKNRQGKQVSAEWPANTEHIRAAQRAYDSAEKDWKEIEPIVTGRFLIGAEWLIASELWVRLTRAYRVLEELIKAILKAPPADGQRLPVRISPLPDAPKPAEVPAISPFELAQTAASLAKQTPKRGVPENCFPAARNLLIQAASFLKEQSTKPIGEFFGSDGVSFADILKSNDNCRALRRMKV